MPVYGTGQQFLSQAHKEDFHRRLRTAAIRRIYLASSYDRNPEMRERRDELVGLGFTVTSRWIDQHDGSLEEALGSKELMEAPERGTQFAVKDIQDIADADTVISFTGNGRGGRHVELGVAIATGKFNIIIGQREHVFHTLPGMDWYPDWDGFISNIRKFRR